MISAGQDFLRSKKGIRNTYQNGDVNALDYRRLSQFENFAAEIRSLIKFRLSTRGQFTRPSTFEDCYYENISMIENDTLGMKIRHKSSNEEFLFLCNPTKKKLLLSLPDDWKKKELIFPSSIEITDTSYLEPSEYRLLVRKF
jgi:pullulanase/glycogen debranching enzyme